jgi:hypothetical protein
MGALLNDRRVQRWAVGEDRAAYPGLAPTIAHGVEDFDIRLIMKLYNG